MSIQIILYIAVAIFAIFIGSQITEGVLLVPYWKSLSAKQFYTYYSQFGPSIGRFYTILTIIAASIPLALAIYCKSIKSKGLNYALVSTFFTALFIIAFYAYFKDTNGLFYQEALSEMELKRALIVWTYWHWVRIIIECLSLVFLILSIVKIQNEHWD